jgi:hypothetical protein
MVSCVQTLIRIQGNMDCLGNKRDYIIFSLFDNDNNVRLAVKRQWECVEIEKWNIKRKKSIMIDFFINWFFYWKDCHIV